MTTENEQSGEQSTTPPTAAEIKAVESAFSAGYSGEDKAPSAPAPAASSPTSKDTTPATEKPATTQTPAASTAPVTKAADGLRIAGFSEDEVKRLLSSVPENSRQYQALSIQMRQINGWIGGINDQLKKLTGAGTTTSASKPSSASAPQAAASEAMKRLKEDLPDVAAALEERLAALSGAPGGPSKEEIEAMVGARVAGELAAFRAEDTNRQQNRLYKAHPELREAAGKAAKGTKLIDLIPDFRLWFSAQPAEFQSEVNNAEDADTVIEAVSKWKEWKKSQTTQTADEQKKAEEERQRRERNDARLKGAMTPTGVPATTPQGQTAQQAFDAAFNGGS